MIQEFKSALAITQADYLDNIFNEVMNSPNLASLVDSNNKIKGVLSKGLSDWKTQILHSLSAETIPTHILNEIDYYQEIKSINDDYFLAHVEIIVQRVDSDSPFYFEANQLAKEQEVEFNPLFKHRFCDRWYLALLNNLQELKTQSIDKQKLLQDLYQRIDTMHQLNALYTEVDEKKSLRLWDMAKTKLRKSDLSNLKRTSDFLIKNSQLYNIANKLGRMANTKTESSFSTTVFEKTTKIEVDSHNFSGDIVGIHNSDDLERLLPIEGMLLASPEFEDIFYKNFAEKKLSTYQQQSKELSYAKQSYFVQTSTESEIDKGPFVIAIDASGSMMGLPEQYAKAFAYGLMKIAHEENRDCYAILFSANQITYELSRENSLSEVLNFLSCTFNGGTDLSPVLETSIDLMGSEKYSNADLIVISDFIAPSQPEALIDKIKQLKTKNNRFHALNLSKHGNPQLLAIFDHCWEYHPSALTRLTRRLKDNYTGT